MNKKGNTILFVLGASVANILVTLIVFMLGLVLMSRLPDSVNETAGQPLVFALFFVSIGVSFVVYRRFIKYLNAKIDMEKYFGPLFQPRRKPPSP